MLDGNYHQPKLTYYVNEKKSAIAPKVTDTGANTIEEQINSSLFPRGGRDCCQYRAVKMLASTLKTRRPRPGIR